MSHDERRPHQSRQGESRPAGQRTGRQCQDWLERGERGAVTAETAMALPLIAVFAVSMAWLVGLGLTQVRALDAARETARAAARSDGTAEAVTLGRRVAPPGSRVSVSQGAATVVVRVTSPVGAPAGLFGSWAAIDVHAEAVAAREPGP